MKILIGTREHDVPENQFAAASPATVASSTIATSTEREAKSQFGHEYDCAHVTAGGLCSCGLIARGRAALNGPLKHFIGGLQRRVVLENLRDEEGDWFATRMLELAELVAKMPQTYDTDGQGRNAIAHLHYFAGGQANWYITEKDKGGGDEPNHQQQAFGLADLFRDGGELGYISIAEILANNGELDFHWTPKPLTEVSRDE